MRKTIFKGVIELGGALLLSLFLISPAFAGFGITPAIIFNNHLLPGSKVDTTVFLVRSTAPDSINIKVNNQLGKIKSWIKIAEGNESFIIPTGTTQFPVHLTITVPKDASYDYYEGLLSFESPVKTTNQPKAKQGQIGIALAAAESFRLTVSDQEFNDFNFTFFSIPQLETGWPIKTVVTIENVGNVQTHPSKVHLDIYNEAHSSMIMSGDINDFTFVDPFIKGDSIGYLPANLPVGKFWADYTIYNKGNAVHADKIQFEVLPRWSLSPKPWLIKAFEYLTATPARVAITSVAGTLLILIIISLILKAMRRKENRQ
jgi:hypothetical protein